MSINVLLHPGEVLAGELMARNEVKSAFAIKIGMYPSHFSDLLKGKRAVSASIAIRLEKELNVPAEFWLGLQMDYDLLKEREKLN
jgi:addiction module HigA family antidote